MPTFVHVIFHIHSDIYSHMTTNISIGQQIYPIYVTSITFISRILWKRDFGYKLRITQYDLTEKHVHVVNGKAKCSQSKMANYNKNMIKTLNII